MDKRRRNQCKHTLSWSHPFRPGDKKKDDVYKAMAEKARKSERKGGRERGKRERQRERHKERERKREIKRESGRMENRKKETEETYSTFKETKFSATGCQLGDDFIKVRSNLTSMWKLNYKLMQIEKGERHGERVGGEGREGNGLN
eukprot:506771-Amorphochlora_amoeboformis.AAC.2